MNDDAGEVGRRPTLSATELARLKRDVVNIVGTRTEGSWTTTAVVWLLVIAGLGLAGMALVGASLR